MITLIKILATGLGSGYIPRFPGTAGSICAAVISWLYPPGFWSIILLCLAGVHICGQGEKILGRHDSPHIVFDEFCGLFIAVWRLDSVGLYIIGLILFRFFDIVKPYPINKLQELPGGWGVMADDIAAGLAARAILFVLMLFL